MKVGNAIIDNHNRPGIVMGPHDPPDDDWLELQDDERMHKYLGMEKYRHQWLSVYPVDGGAIIAVEELVEDCGEASEEVIRETFKNANVSARDTMLLLPDLPEDLEDEQRIVRNERRERLTTGTNG
jgi:hypothetical protein